MSNYKEQLHHKLIDSGWERVEIMKGVDWWAEAHWKIQSVKQNWGVEIYIHFEYDLMGFCGLGKYKVVLDIEATTNFKNDCFDQESIIASMYLQKGKFEKNMNTFIQKINTFRESL